VPVNGNFLRLQTIWCRPEISPRVAATHPPRSQTACIWRFWRYVE
jgi:hypothetical protein